MPRRFIDFISAYCDSWCARCALTERCSHFAITSALAMCDGNAEAAFELAIGRPRVPGQAPPKPLGERMADAIGDSEPTQKELDEIGRELDQRRERIRRHPLAQASLDYAVATYRWLSTWHGGEGPTDPGVREAVDVIGWDSHLIHAKTMRALDGHDEYPGGAPFEKSAVQSDWNGSAKVACLSIERSERAWRVVAAATHDEAAEVLADSLTRLRQEMATAFPRAMEFRRPGFDG